MAEYIYNPSTQEAETRESLVQGQTKLHSKFEARMLHSETTSQNRNNNNSNDTTNYNYSLPCILYITFIMVTLRIYHVQS